MTNGLKQEQDDNLRLLDDHMRDVWFLQVTFLRGSKKTTTPNSLKIPLDQLSALFFSADLHEQGHRPVGKLFSFSLLDVSVFILLR